METLGLRFVAYYVLFAKFSFWDAVGVIAVGVLLELIVIVGKPLVFMAGRSDG